jgi:hypothetical protein
LGPFTRIKLPWISTSTFGGTTTGKRPILDTVASVLPHFSQELATNTELAGALPSHHTLGGRDDGDTHA